MTGYPIAMFTGNARNRSRTLGRGSSGTAATTGIATVLTTGDRGGTGTVGDTAIGFTAILTTRTSAGPATHRQLTTTNGSTGSIAGIVGSGAGIE